MWTERVKQLLRECGWQINNTKLFEQALTHSSYAHEKGRHNGHNERLEFLGDAVLELIISDYLYANYPHFSEGKLTKLRADLVCETSLAKLAYRINLGSYLRLGKGEAFGGGSNRPSLLADAMEALIGALYLEVGLEQCRRYVLALFSPVFQDLEEGILRQDFKTLIQEYAQASRGVTPEYRIIGESGPDHDKIFEAEILLNLTPMGRGKGRSKKEAEQAAAKEAWNKLMQCQANN